ncbi:type 1 fimbrial protein [Enterobacter cloacae]|uniref:fimbrial protein n=1 Tax=Enterobacter cloacae TaxID=550 RepID=UPI0034A2A9D9
MKLTLIALALPLMIGSAVANAQVKDQGHGTVTFTGSIIDSPCSISPDTVDQTISLGEVSNKTLENGGRSAAHPFNIKLEGCDTTTANTVSTTFTGAESSTQAGHLGITGSAKGAAIVLTDGSGADITLGQPTAAQKIQDGSNTLLFSAYMEGDSGSSTITPGDFQGVADFTLAYQ